MTWVAIRIAVSAISGILIFDLIRPDFLILFTLIAATFVAGLFEKRLLYITIFLLSGLNYLLIRPVVEPYHYISGTGSVIESRPYYGRYLTLIQSRNGIFEMATRKDLKDSRVYFRGFIKKDEKSKIRVEPITAVGINRPTSFRRLFTLIRERIIKATEVIIKDDNRGLLVSLLLGRSYYPRQELWDFFARAGIIHLLTVSGLHVGFILSFGIILFTGLGLRKRPAYVIALILIPLYAGITGFRPPVIRASIMLGMIGVANLIERKVPTIHFLVIGLLVLVIFDPLVVFNPGGQLSFAAAIAIILLYKEFKDSLPKMTVVRYILASMLVSASAQLATAPILIYYFGRIPTLGVLTNLLVVPIAWITVALGLFTVIVYQMSPFLAKFLGLGLNLILEIIIFLARQVSSLGFSSVEAAWIPTLIFPPFYLLFLKKVRIYALITLLILSNLFMFLPASFRLEIEGKRMSVSPPGIDLSQIVDKYPVDIKINDLKISKVNRELTVQLGLVDEKIIKDGIYHITKTGIIREGGDNILIRFYDELRLLFYRMNSIGVS